MTVNIRSADPGVKMQDMTPVPCVFTDFMPPIMISSPIRHRRFSPLRQGLGQVGYETADRVSDQEIKIEDVVTQPGVVDMFTRTISSSPLIVRSSGPRNISAMRSGI